MAIFNLKNYTDKDGLGFPLNFRRGAPNPLDNSSVWDSLEAAKNYAETSVVAYVGQLLSVVDNEGGKVDVYSIQDEAGTLKKVGTSPVGDEKSITVAEDGTVSLYGIAGLELTRDDGEGHVTNITYQPLLVNGALTWVEPSATTVEGLDTRLQATEGKLTTIEAAIGVVATETAEATGIYKLIADGDAAQKAHTDEINTTLLEAIGAETEARTTAITNLDSSLKEYVGTEIGKQAHFSAKVVSSTEEMTDSTVLYLVKDESATGIDKYNEYLVIEGVATLIGDTTTDLSNYYNKTEADGAIDAKVKVVNDALETYKTEVASTHETVLERIENLENVGAEKNVINSVDTAQFAIDDNRKLTLLDIAMDKITGLTTALAGKVDTVEGSTLLSSTDKQKLDALVLGDGGGVEISGKVNIANVQGLDDYVAQNKFISGTLLDKINGIQDGAQANVIESIKIEGAENALAISGKAVTIPKATEDVYGVIKVGAEATNNIVSVNEEGVAQVKKVSINSLEQDEGEELIFNCGSAD